jgi:hypothetical protein
MFHGVVQFSDGSLVASAISAMQFPCYRLIFTDDSVRVEARWSAWRFILPSRSCELGQVISARLRGTFIIVSLPEDEWWTVSSPMRSTQIMREFESRGVPTTRDP